MTGLTVGQVFKTLPGYLDKTDMRVAYLRRLGYGIRTLKSGGYRVLFIPSITENNVTKPDKVYNCLSDGLKHRANDIASGNGITRQEVTDAVCQLRRRGIRIITGNRGTEMWYKLDDKV